MRSFRFTLNRVYVILYKDNYSEGKHFTQNTRRRYIELCVKKKGELYSPNRNI
jgi:hypothetical protein